MKKSDPIRETDDDARATARRLMDTARTASLAVLTPDGLPFVTMVAFGRSAEGDPLSLVSDLSEHTRCLRANPECSVLIGGPGDRGDPLNHPRLTLQAHAAFVPNGTPGYEKMATHYLRSHPKAKLYIGFADFSFLRFTVTRGHLNAGFGKAFVLTPADLGLPA